MWPICSLSLSSLLWLLGPLILGLLTAWWVWGGRGNADVDTGYRAPAAEPVRFTEPAVTAPPVSVAPVAAAAALTGIGIPAAVGAADDLLQLKGVGPKLNELLHSLGVHRFDQIANWTAGDVAKVDEHLGSFSGRIDRESWVEQAGLLARGAIAEFEAKFGKLDSEN